MKLTIKESYKGKTVTRSLAHGKQSIEVDKIKPSQYSRVWHLGFKEIFEQDGTEEKETASNEETTNGGGITPTVERVQSVEKKPRKKRSNS